MRWLKRDEAPEPLSPELVLVDPELERPARGLTTCGSKEAEATMSMYASDFSGGVGLGFGGTLSLGTLREPPLSPPMTGRSAPVNHVMSAEGNGSNGFGIAEAPIESQPVEPLIAATEAIVGAPESQPIAQNAVASAPLTAQSSLPFVDLHTFTIDRTAARLIPEQIARLHTALPIGFDQGLPLVAVADPNATVMESVRLALGCDARFAVASRDDLVASIAAAYTEPVAPALGVLPVTPAAPAVVGEPVPAFETAAYSEPIAPIEPAVLPVEPVAEVAPVQPIIPFHSETFVSEPESFISEPVEETPVEAIVAQPQFEVVEPELTVEAHEPEAHEAETRNGQFRVFVRLSGGDGVEIGSFEDVETAKTHAAEIVREIADASTWPFYKGRYLRPDSILSVDIVEETRW